MLDGVFDSREEATRPSIGSIETRERPLLMVLAPDAADAKALAERLEADAWNVDLVDTLAGAESLVRHRRPHIAIVPMQLGSVTAPVLIEKLHEIDPLLSVLVLSDRAEVSEVVDAMHAGAEHVMVRSAEPAALRGVIRRALDRQRARGRIRELPRATSAGARVPWLLGESEPMQSLAEQIALVASTRSTVLLLGETGTGKEGVANAVHTLSSRAQKPFVRVHCAALAETLLESELFGHERGAFTGAHNRREGRFKIADGGTILLDEIGEVSPSIQVKLLRVLQERCFERVGGTDTVSVDVRLIAATHRDLKAMVVAGTFRADLFYRLNVVTLEIPSLRARRSDIPILVEHHLARLARETGIPAPRVTPEAMRLLRRYDWPGNIRELENVLERAIVMCRGRVLEASALEPHFSPGMRSSSEPRIPGATFAEIERHAILTTYEACGRSPLRTAETLGLSPRTVHYRLREYAGGAGRRRAKTSTRSDDSFAED